MSAGGAACQCPTAREPARRQIAIIAASEREMSVSISNAGDAAVLKRAGRRAATNIGAW